MTGRRFEAPSRVRRMKIFNLYGDNWDEPRDREGWRIKEAFVGHRIGGALIGASMAEVETLALGAFHGGPRAINAFAELGDGYLREWEEPLQTPTRVAWPDEWAPDVARFR